MILGVGCDIVSIERISNVLLKTPAFLTHVFSNNEITEYKRRKNDIAYLATRFAAKEAIVKAFKEYNDKLNTIEILNKASGEPYVRIHGEDVNNLFISLSYEKDYVIAYAVLSSIN